MLTKSLGTYECSHDGRSDKSDQVLLNTNPNKARHQRICLSVIDELHSSSSFDAVAVVMHTPTPIIVSTAAIRTRPSALLIESNNLGVSLSEKTQGFVLGPLSLLGGQKIMELSEFTTGALHTSVDCGTGALPLRHCRITMLLLVIADIYTPWLQHWHIFVDLLLSRAVQINTRVIMALSATQLHSITLPPPSQTSILGIQKLVIRSSRSKS